MATNGFLWGVHRTIRFPSPFDLLQQRMTDVLGDGGIFKEVLHPGEGPPVPQNATVSVHYSGYLEYADQPFETTTNLLHPRLLKTGRELTLWGLELGLLTMKRGELSRFLFQPEYAYGDLGCPPLIPAAARVLYEVQILDYLDSGQVDQFFAMSLEEQSSAPLPEVLQVTNTLRSLGNNYFSWKQHKRAKDSYKQASLQSKSEKEEIQTALLPLYLNLSLAELRLESWNKALKYASKALEVDSCNTKALYRSGQAYLELGDCKTALRFLKAAQAKKPYDADINNLLQKVAIQCKDSLDKEKDFCSKMFRSRRSPDKM
ncbi:Inactive peptidyl-prolyl cis-trans isomerase FKBP6 [Oryzias melastigma]|uniref:peptidylprolyl isomerase n=1 Tax=Oryzias melastigma TaxID=30732 RepID=A0A834CNY1_ORYME|nr:Inactive peptidyl-prolyl cis-trans isomerase FKBP6 [Oryzias melastigma]